MKKKWAVVQDLQPFGYRIERKYYFRSLAVLAANVSKYLEVRPLEWINAENKRLESMDEFNKEFKQYQQQRRKRSILCTICYDKGIHFAVTKDATGERDIEHHFATEHPIQYQEYLNAKTKSS